MNTTIRQLKIVILITLIAAVSGAEAQGMFTAPSKGRSVSRVVPARRAPAARVVPVALATAALVSPALNSAAAFAPASVPPTTEEAPVREFAGNEMLSFFGRVIDMVAEKDATVRLDSLSIVAY